MELEHLLKSVAPSIKLDPLSDNDQKDFRDYLSSKSNINETIDYIAVALPKPRLDFYSSSNYNDI